MSGVAASDEESIRLLRAALLFGSGRRRARGIQLSRAAARRRCPDGGHCTHVRSTCGAVRSSPLVSRVEMFVIVSSVRSRSPVRRSCGCFEASWHSRALWFGERSVARPYNNQMEPSRRAVCAIMSPSARLIWRFRRSEKHSAKQTKSEACGMVHVRRRGTWSSQAQSTTRIRLSVLSPRLRRSRNAELGGRSAEVYRWKAAGTHMPRVQQPIRASTRCEHSIRS